MHWWDKTYWYPMAVYYWLLFCVGHGCGWLPSGKSYFEPMASRMLHVVLMDYKVIGEEILWNSKHWVLFINNMKHWVLIM